MKKKPLVWLCGIAIIALVIYFFLGVFLGSVVTAGINSFGPKLTKTKVELSGAHISPFTGTGHLNGLEVGNPEGWSSPRAFYIGKMYVKMKPFSIFGDYIEIEEIVVEEAEFVYETKVISSNIKDLLKNIEEFTGSGGQEPKAKDGKSIKFVVKKFRMSQGTARLGVGPAAIPVPLPPITLNNLGVAAGGITPDELTSEIMQSVLTDIVSATGKATLKAGGTVGAAAVHAAGEGLKKTGEGIKKLFGK